MTVVMKVAIEGEHVEELRVIAAQRRTTVPKLIADALRRDRVTRQAFQAKEDTK